MSDTKTHDRWWICTDWLSHGGKKVLGPFESRELAIAVRSLLEQVNKPRSYFVDDGSA